MIPRIAMLIMLIVLSHGLLMTSGSAMPPPGWDAAYGAPGEDDGGYLDCATEGASCATGPLVTQAAAQTWHLARSFASPVLLKLDDSRGHTARSSHALSLRPVSRAELQTYLI